MMRHIFGAAAIPLPPPVNQLQRDVGRASVEGRERAGRCGEAVLFNADSQTHPPPPPPPISTQARSSSPLQ